jgi:hypothetical protein
MLHKIAYLRGITIKEELSIVPLLRTLFFLIIIPSSSRTHSPRNLALMDPLTASYDPDVYLNGKLRTIVADLFRGMTVSHNPDLLQELPAEKKHKLKTNSEFVALTEELESEKRTSKE